MMEVGGGVVLSMKEVSSSLTTLVKDGVEGSASLLTGSSEGGGGVAAAGSAAAASYVA